MKIKMNILYIILAHIYLLNCETTYSLTREVKMEPNGTCTITYLSGQKLIGECISQNEKIKLKPFSSYKLEQNSDLYHTDIDGEITYKAEQENVFNLKMLDPIITECKKNCISGEGEGNLIYGDLYSGKNYTFSGKWKGASPYEGNIYFNKIKGECRDENEKVLNCSTMIVYSVKDGVHTKGKFYEKSEKILADRKAKKEEIEYLTRKQERESQGRENKRQKERDLKNCDRVLRNCLSRGGSYGGCKGQLVFERGCENF